MEKSKSVTKQPRRLAAAVLMLSLLLSLLGGGFASASGSHTVTTDAEPVYEPLAQTASVAYEEHEEGYAVSLRRAADSVTMSITAAPGDENSRAAEKARLYIRTGVELKPGTVYQVSFSLSAENAQPEYAVSFDGGSAKGAYGALTGRGIEADGEDQVQYLITPEKESGELVLRLLLGKTGAKGNTFRFSGLAVGEVSNTEDEAGETVPLVESLDYNVGAISMWANAGCRAEVSTTDDSATVTVLEKPAKGAEVWEIQMKVATGVKPEPGKIYRVSAVLSSTMSLEYEICFNEGDREKGYDALYGQWLSDGMKNITHMIITPTNKENLGELVLQFSLGKLGVGEQATVSGIRVEEIIPQYINALAHDFTYDETWVSEKREQVVSGGTPIETNINWSGEPSISAGGDYSGGVTVDGGSATMKINAGSKEVYHAYMLIDTGERLKAGVTYQVSYTLETENAYPDAAEILCGSGSGKNGDRNYDAIFGHTLNAGSNTVTHRFVPGASGGLQIRLQLGKTGGAANTVTVRDFTVEEVAVTLGPDIASVIYPVTRGRFAIRADSGHDGVISGDGSSVTVTCTGGAGDGCWRRGLWIDDICDIAAGQSYEVRFKITANPAVDFEVCYSDVRQSYDPTLTMRYGLNTDTTNEVVQGITATKDAKLSLRIDFGKADTGTEVTVSDIEVYYVGVPNKKPPVANISEATYPNTSSPDAKDSTYFEVRSGHGSITGDGESVTMTRVDKSDPSENYDNGLFIGKAFKGICELAVGNSYEVSFDIQVTEGDKFNFNVFYNKDHQFDGEKVFGERYDLTASETKTTFKYTISPKETGKLLMFLEFGKNEDSSPSRVTISNISVRQAEHTSSDLARVTYPSGPPNGSLFEARDGNGTVGGDGATYATMTCVEQGEKKEAYERGLLTNKIATLEAGESYQVSVTFESSTNAGIEICYNKDGDWGPGHEKGFDVIGNLTASPQPLTVTYTATADEGNSNDLSLRFDLGLAKEGTVFTVRDIHVYKIVSSESTVKTFDSFATSSIWVETDSTYTAQLVRNRDNVNLAVEKMVYDTAPATWKAKLYIDTGVPYQANKGYRVSFDILSPAGVEDFCAIYNTSDETYKGKFGEKLSSNDTKTVVSDGLPAGNGNVQVSIELGNFTGLSNSFTVSNVQVEEVNLDVFVSEKDDGTVNCDMQGNYKADLIREEHAASINITQAPDQGAEIWKMKMFILTGVQASKNETYRVTFDLLSEEDMDFEVCYNKDADEKGFSAFYGLRAEGGSVTTVEKSFFSTQDGALNLQLSLGLSKAPNRITVNNLKVERIVFSSSRDVLPAALDYRVPGAISYWSHEDYATAFAGSDDAVTAKITGAPQVGAEPWKIKLFLDTGLTLEPGKNYKVTADVSAKASQAYEICYNNGGVEMGYDSMGGLRLVGGRTQTVERIVSVPANKTDLNNLMLQFNLGKTNTANEVTVSGVKVEEVPVSYTEMMANDFTYADSAAELWTNPDYVAALEGSDDAATVHITGVSEDAAVWKVKLFINTGVILTPGKTYLVSADMQAAKAQKYEVCYNNEETEKGYDAIYDQPIEAGSKTTVEHNISVPVSMTDAGELILQFAIGGSVANDITVSNVSVQEISFGADDVGTSAPDTVIDLYNAPGTAAGTLEVTREKLSYTMRTISPESKDNAITIAGADLRANDRYMVTFTARSDKDMTGAFVLRQADGGTAALSEQFALTAVETAYSFTTSEALSEGGYYDLVWQFGSEDNRNLGGARVELSGISVSCPSETLAVARSGQKVTVNGNEVTAEIYSINGYNYFKLRDLAMMLNDTDAQFVVRYNPKTDATSLTTGKAYTPVGGELETGADQSASCVRNSPKILVNGETLRLKAYNIGGNNYFRLRDLNELLGFKVEYIPESDTVEITSPLTPEAQESAHAYDLFFLPEPDGTAQPYVGDTMPYYEDGVYYIYYLKEGGDSYNHSVYLTTTTDFVTYTEQDDPVLTASREDVQDSWIGTGSVVKVDGAYYFFYTGFNSSGSQEYHEKIMVAKSSSPTSFEKVRGWEIVPPDELGQKNDFRDPQAYYDPDTQTISLTVTASQGGTARILKYTLDKDLKNAKYDGIIFTDPTGRYWNLECSDTFRIGDKWYLTYSGQDDTLWYAMADSRFGPYSNAERLDGKLFYAAKHVEDGTNSYLVGWARRSGSASSTEEVNGWAGNVVVQKLRQQENGSLVLVPVDGIVSEFATQKDLVLGATEATLTAGEGYSYREAFTSGESFLLSGEFTCSGEGTFGLAFDFNGEEEQYKLISIDPAANKLSLSFNGGTAPMSETRIALEPDQKYSFTYIQDGSVGIFYLDGQASLVVRLYGVTDKPIYLFAENNTVTFTSLRQCIR